MTEVYIAHAHGACVDDVLRHALLVLCYSVPTSNTSGGVREP